MALRPPLDSSSASPGAARGGRLEKETEQASSLPLVVLKPRDRQLTQWKGQLVSWARHHLGPAHPFSRIHLSTIRIAGDHSLGPYT